MKRFSLFLNNMKLTLCLFVIMCLLCFISGGYIVTTPRKWSSGQASQVCVILPSPATSEEALNVAIMGDIAKKEFILNPKDLPLPEGKTNICNQVLLPHTKANNGTLLISGSLEGATLNESRAINIVADVAETFVQTDKFVYQPQQTVQFRILTVIGPYLNISLDQYDEIWIENPSGIRIVQWLNVPNKNGLIHMSFALSDDPEQGKYQIHVRRPFGKTKDQTFKVEEYILPRYEVVINPQRYLLGISDTVTFKVCAKYTFGQPLKGYVTLYVHNDADSFNPVVVKMKGKIRGCKTFILNSTELSIDEDHYVDYTLIANANVTEEGTGVELQAKEVSVDIPRTALKFEDISVQKYDKPEIPYIVEIRVTEPDERPAPNEPMKVCCGQICQNFTTNADGILKFAVPPHLQEIVDIGSVNSHGIMSTGRRYTIHESSFRKRIKKYHSPSNSSLVIAISSEELECSATKELIDLKLPIQFAAAKQSSASITVQVISRGQIQLSQTFEQLLNVSGSFDMDESLLLEPLKEPATKDLIRGHFTISISLPKTISPEAQIIIWYTRSDKEVVSDVRKLDITECLLNPVNMDWSSDIVRPGDQATLSLQAEPSSFCSLGVVDKNVHLLSSKKTALTLKSLLTLSGKSSVGKYENLQVDNSEYCKGTFPEEPSFTESPPLLPPFALPLMDRKKRNSETGKTPTLEDVLLRRKKRSSISNDITMVFYSDDVDALHMFDEAGIYVISDLILESRRCQMYSPMGPALICSWEPSRNAYVMRGLRRPMFDERDSAATRLPEESEDDTSEQQTSLPETWLWHIRTIPEMGVMEEKVTLPNTVTEWVASAVCVHPTKGVGASLSSSITTFRDFFVDFIIPPSAKRGEIFPVKISVFNYLKEPLPVKVILEESSQYDILADNGEDLGSGERRSCLLSQDQSVHAIRIRPKEIGNINLTVSAFIDTNSITTCSYTSDGAPTDVLVKSILVEIEGVPKEKTWSKYICVQDIEWSEDSFETWTIHTPASIIPDSARGFVTVVGDLMGPSIENLGSLVKMPSGCGEQNMLNFASNIFVMQYLDFSNQNSVNIAERAIQFMKNGYQRELNYRHRNGSFSAFGESDDSGSTWLTAFVLKSFAQARDYIDVDSEDLDISREWLKRRQLENGCFESLGKVLHKGMKGGLQNSHSPVLLSSFVLIALIEVGEGDASTSVQEALFCLGADEPTKNPYSLAVKAYALALAGSPDARSVIDSLLELATTKGSTLHWELPEGYETSKGVDVETAGYVVLALLAHGMKLETDFPNVKKIIKWMNNQRNGQGGFVSTQDTIVALQALAQFERSIPQSEVDAHVIVQTTDLESVITVNERNKLLLQKTDLLTIPTTVNVHVSGTGCVLVQAILRYNIPDAERSEAFSLRVNSTEADKGCKAKRITACASYLLPDQKSNMAIMEMNLVSGYIPDKSDLKRIVGNGTDLFKRYEVDGSVVMIYVDEFSREEICVSLRIMRDVQVENPKPGFVKVYDYYKPEFFATMKYELPPSTECLEESVEFLHFGEDIVGATSSNRGEMLDALN